MNRSDKRGGKPQNRFDESNLFSKFSYFWVINILKVGFNKPIVEEDIYECAENQKSNKSFKKFKNIWSDELNERKPQLVKSIMKFCGLKIFLVGIPVMILEMISKLAGPLLLGLLIAFFTDNPYQHTRLQSFYIATGIIFTQLAQVLLYYPYKYFVYIQSIKLKTACSSLIYEKILSFSKFTMTDGISGQAINLLSNDIIRFDLALLTINDVLQHPIGTFIAGYLIYSEIGLSAFSGLVIFILFMPFQAWLGKKSANVRLSTAKRTDKRMRVILSMLKGIHVIKMYGWEQAFSKVIRDIRKLEVRAIARGYNIRATLLSFEILSKVAIFLSLVVYVVTGHEISARKAFIVIAYFDFIHRSVIIHWPEAVTFVSEGYVAVKRIEEFLLHNISNRNLIDCETDEDMRQSKKGIVLNEATAYWNQEYSSMGIFKVNLNTEDHKLIAVTGHVGSGKTSLLEVLIKELPLISGEMFVNGSISYAAQQSWIFEGSVRNNIIFTETFDEDRYKEVCQVCSLERDFELMPHGDQTIVGDRGVSLSGGQKSRINLARAVYRNTDVYLLDDPLSAVDPHVCKNIFEDCIKKFLKGKITILVTHQLQFLSQVEHILVMKAGQIQMQGSFNEVKSADLEFKKILENYKETSVDAKKSKITESKSVKSKKINEKQEISKEAQQLGKVETTVYKDYFRAVNSCCFVVCVGILFIMTQIIDSCLSIFVSIWLNWEDSHNIALHGVGNSTITYDTNWSTEKYIYVYSGILTVLAIVVTLRAFAFYRMCLRISKNLHDVMLKGVNRTFMFFFNQNPTGRILNRFSKDVGTVDSTLPVVVVDCIKFFLELAGVTAIVVSTNYWLIFPTLIMCTIFCIARVIFLTTARNLKRVESISRSLIFSHITASLEGLTTIRACGAEEQLTREFEEVLDSNTSAFFLFMSTSRAFAFWLDIVCVIYVSSVTYSFLLLKNGAVGASIGLAITQTMNLIRLVNWGLRQTAELENQMTSVERSCEYSSLPAERSLETDPETLKKLSSDFAKRGAIKFDKLSLKYSNEGECVLHNLTFEIHEREKVGIIGRTGSGKSSVTQALFQLAITEGRIFIDDVDISSIGLHAIRQNISIIPQDPILFVGSLRYNLDPFNEKTDVEIWRALEQVELKETVKTLTGGLESKVSDDGSNFSMGQRQLICLARAILKNNKILILDEATANVDPETDKLIQATIRSQFGDCTVLTVAHRLNTIIDSDRILVLDAGNIVDFDTPQNLYKNVGGVFRKLFDETGLNSASLEADKKL